MPSFQVETTHYTYASVVERGILHRIRDYIPAKAGRIFIVTTEDVWNLHGNAVRDQLPDVTVLFFAGGEDKKRLATLEHLAEQMVAAEADRTSIVIGFGGGIVTDISGFLAAVFMRGIPVLQIPTTLLAQVDAGIGGKTGVNLANGKNLIGSFHQPLAVLIDPAVLSTLSDREYRAGLFEVVKTGIIRDPVLFDLMVESAEQVLAREPGMVDELICRAVRVKAEVVTADEKESDLRRILNFGHTIGHAIEAETKYLRFLHGEAIAWGMLAATRLAELLNLLSADDGSRVQNAVRRYGPLPSAHDLSPDCLIARLSSDKKTLQGKVHFVLPTRIGAVQIVSGVDHSLVRQAIVESLT